MEEKINNQEIMMDKFEELSEENTKMLKEKLSEIENLTDEELEIIAGGGNENRSQGYETFLLLARAALLEIHRGNMSMAIHFMRLIRPEHRRDPKYINLREAFRKKFNKDPGHYGL